MHLASVDEILTYPPLDQLVPARRADASPAPLPRDGGVPQGASMATKVTPDQRNTDADRNPRRRRRTFRSPWLLAGFGALLLTGFPLFGFLASPGEVIRLELEAAAAEMSWQLVPTPSKAVLAAMRRDFHGREVSIAIASASTIAVTLAGLARDECIDAWAKTRRIEGPAVVVLEGYGSAQDCRSRNDMTWWIMP